MSFKQLYAHNLYELSENAKKKISSSEEYEVLGEKKQNFRAPFSWIVGGLSYCASPFVALFKSAVDYKTRHISDTSLSTAKTLLSDNSKNKEDLLKHISSNFNPREYKSSTSKELLISLKKSDNEKQRQTKIIEFLDNPLAKGTTLQRNICHFITLWSRTSKSEEMTYQNLTRDGRRDSTPSRTG